MKYYLFAKRVTFLAGLLISSGLAFGHGAGEVGSVTDGHLRDASNNPVKDSVGECWHIGAISASPDCVVQPAPPAPTPVAQATPAPPPATKQSITLQGDALFDFNKATLKQTHVSELDEAIEKIRGKDISTHTIKVVGHTDDIGSDAYNKKLALRRAQAVKDYMVSKGVDPNKIEVEGKGEQDPIASNKTKEGRSQNRRVSVVFTAEETLRQ